MRRELLGTMAAAALVTLLTASSSSPAGPGKAAGPVHGTIDDLDQRVTRIETGGPIGGDFVIGGDLTVQGRVTADSFGSSTTRIGYLTVGQAAFHPDAASNAFVITGFATGAFSTQAGILVAPVQLPDFSRILRVTCYLYDADPDNDLRCSLFRHRLSDGDTEYLIYRVSAGDGGHQELVTSPEDMTIENFEYGYYVAVYPDQGHSWGSSGSGPLMGIKGVTFRYEVTIP